MSIRIPCALLLSGAFMLSSCATLPPAGQPTRVRDAAQLQLASTVEPVRVDERGWPETNWWTALGDPQLDQLELEALAVNPTLASAKARLDRALAVAGINRSNLWPQTDLNARSARQRFSGNDTIPPPYAGTTQTQSRVALDFSYELDFWGKNHAALAAALNRADAAEVDSFAARLDLGSVGRS